MDLCITAASLFVTVAVNPLVKPRPPSATSIPAILKLLQDEWVSSQCLLKLICQIFEHCVCSRHWWWGISDETTLLMYTYRWSISNHQMLRCLINPCPCMGRGYTSHCVSVCLSVCYHSTISAVYPTFATVVPIQNTWAIAQILLSLLQQFKNYDSLYLTMEMLVGASGRKSSPGH